MTQERHSRRASAALQKLAEDDPAFASLSLWCNHRDAGISQYARSDAKTVYYGPRFSDLRLAERMGLVAHHVLHIALRHARRGGALRQRLGDSFDSELFNLGADALINDTLAEVGLIQPRPHPTLSSLGQPEESLRSFDVERLFYALVDQRQPQNGRQSRSEVSQRASDGFEGDLDIAQTGEEADNPNSPSELEWRQHLERALEAGRIAGRGLGMLGHRLADIAESTTAWEVLLRRLAARALQEAPKQSFRRPAGRWVAMESAARNRTEPTPAFQPSQQRFQHRPRIVVGLDSSGSVSHMQLSLFAAQISAIARRSGAELHLLVFDEAVRSSKILVERDLPGILGELRFSRDGGTDFRPVLVDAVSRNPSLIVMLSDLDGPLPDLAPTCPVIWALPGAPRAAPPFGTALRLDT